MKKAERFGNMWDIFILLAILILLDDFSGNPDCFR